MKRYVRIALAVIAIYIAVSSLISLSAISPQTSDTERKPRKLTKQIPVPLQTPYLDKAHVGVPNQRFQGLLEHSTSLNTSRLKTCNVEAQTVSFSQGVQVNGAHAYRLLVPKWQSRSRKSRDTRHFLSAVVRLRLYKEDTAGWTIAELKQWIHYQLWAGAEHIYICNHYLSKEEDIAEDLVKYSKAGLVTVIDWSNKNVHIGGPFAEKQELAYNQIGCYNHVRSKYGRLSKWMFTFDMDENPYCPGDHCEGFLSRYLQTLDKTIGAVMVDNYVLHGQGDRSRDIHYDRINRISPNPQNGNVKPIFKIKLTSSIGMHRVVLKRGETLNQPPGLKMLHYWGGRAQNFGPDTEKTFTSTEEFNDVRESIAVVVRHSLLAFGEFDAFSSDTGP